MNIIFSILEQANKNPARIAYEFIDNPHLPIQLTYVDLLKRVSQTASFLEQQGAKAGDRIIIALNQSLDYLTSFYACISKGLIAVPVCAVSRENQWARLLHVMNDCNARFICGDSKSESLLSSCLEKAYLDDMRLITVDKITSEATFETLTLNSIQTNPIAFLQYTSGSTGYPKGVMVSHDNLIANFHMMQNGMKIDSTSKIVSWLPLFHDMGLIGAGLLSIYSGATLYLMSPLRFLRNPMAWVEAISKNKGTHAYAPNFAYDLLVIHAESYLGDLDLSSWIVALSGAEPIRFNTAARFMATFKKYHFRPESFYPAYGMAESTLYVTGSDVGVSLSYDVIDATALQLGNADLSENDSGNKQTVISCGKPRMGSQIFIVNPATLELCSNRTIGEIWVKGEHVCKGYFGKPELTEEVFGIYTVDKKVGPCLRTGDLGYLNEKGELFVTSRIKDLIIVNGKNLIPQDIEETVQKTSEAVRANSVAAFSVDNGEKEELIVVVELRRSFTKTEADALAAQIKREIFEEYDVLTSEIIFGRRGSVPRTTSGKLQRQLCKKNLMENTLQRIEFLEKEVSV